MIQTSTVQSTPCSRPGRRSPVTENRGKQLHRDLPRYSGKDQPHCGKYKRWFDGESGLWWGAR